MVDDPAMVRADRLVCDVSTFLETQDACDDSSLRWSERRDGDTVVLSVAGELDLATAEPFRRLLLTAAGSAGAATVVLDMSEVGFIDALSVGVIVQASTVARRAGREWRVIGVNGLSEKLFELLGLQDMIARLHVVGPPEGRRDDRR